MPILPESKPISHAPYLLLPAPKIAGLLAAGPQPDTSATTKQAESSPTELIFTDPRLANFLPWTYADVRQAVTTLLDVAVGLLNGEADRRQFAEASIQFSGKIAMLSRLLNPESEPPTSFVKTRAEMDADYDLMREQGRQQLLEHIEQRRRQRETERASRAVGRV